MTNFSFIKAKISKKKNYISNLNEKDEIRMKFHIYHFLISVKLCLFVQKSIGQKFFKI